MLRRYVTFNSELTCGLYLDILMTQILKPWGIVTILLFSFCLTTKFIFADEQKIILGHFSQQSNVISDTWSPLVFGSIEKHTSYTLVSDQNVKVVHINPRCI